MLNINSLLYRRTSLLRSGCVGNLLAGRLIRSASPMRPDGGFFSSGSTVFSLFDPMVRIPLWLNGEPVPSTPVTDGVSVEDVKPSPPDPLPDGPDDDGKVEDDGGGEPVPSQPTPNNP